MNTMDDYRDLCLKTDVLLLADVFEKLINKCLEYYGLDPYHYFSSAGLAWDAMLKMTKIELELISYTDMHYFIEKGMRGGIFCINSKKLELMKVVKFLCLVLMIKDTYYMMVLILLLIFIKI